MYEDRSKEELIDILEYIDEPIYSLGGLCIRVCEFLSCENCPVKIYDCDNRTEEDRHYHVPCYGELYKWMQQEAIKVLRENGYFVKKIPKNIGSTAKECCESGCGDCTNCNYFACMIGNE